jgi:hypothetical protein
MRRDSSGLNTRDSASRRRHDSELAGLSALPGISDLAQEDADRGLLEMERQLNSPFYAI